MWRVRGRAKGVDGDGKSRRFVQAFLNPVVQTNTTTVGGSFSRPVQERRCGGNYPEYSVTTLHLKDPMCKTAGCETNVVVFLRGVVKGGG
jgi:hypothetical protein